MELFEFLSAFFLEHGYAAVLFVLLLCGLGLPIPEEITLIGAGLVVYKGDANLHVMIAVTVFGILLGDSMLFYLGRHFGPRLVNHRYFSRIFKPERMEKVERQFGRHGAKVVFFARFFAGIRACVYFSAGTLNMRYRTFLLLDLLGAMISAPVSVWLGFHFGGHIEEAFMKIAELDHAIYIVFGAVVLFYLVRYAIRRVRRPKD